jgi:hypothetical protein
LAAFCRESLCGKLLVVVLDLFGGRPFAASEGRKIANVPLCCGIAEIRCKTDDPTSSTSEKPESWLTNMIYRIITDFRMIQFQSDPNQKEVVWQFVLPATREDQ